LNAAPKIPTNTLLQITIILLLGFAVLISGLLDTSLWADEGWTIAATAESNLVNVVTEWVVGDVHPPLFFINLSIWRSFTGDSLFELRYFSVIVSMLGIAITYRAGRSLFGRRAGLLAALFYSLHDLIYVLTHEVRHYPQQVALSALAALTEGLGVGLAAPLLSAEATEQMGLGKSNGWWNAIAAEDLDNDGDIDFVVGNHGLNSRFETSIEKPATLYINDFDRNGTAEQILSLYEGDISYPLVLKHDLVMQMPSLKKKYLKYESYKEQTVNDLFTPAQLENAIVLKAFTFESSVLLNNGKGKFKVVALPSEAQFSPVYGISIADFNGDKNKDILLGGNFYNAKPEVGRYDADFGLLLKGRGDGSYKVVKSKDSGFNNRGQIRDLKLLEYTGGDLVLAAKNDGKLQVFKF